MAQIKLAVLLVPVFVVALASDSDNRTEGRNLREGKNILDWIGLGTGSDTDPYLARANSACLEGDLAECFKSRALASLDDFFDKDVYALTDSARIIRMPGSHLRALKDEPYEFSTAPRAEESEWDQFVKFMLRRVERFMKSMAIEVQFPQEVTERGRYSPRFIDEIATEIDLLEDKNDSPFYRTKLKKLFIPLLVILKLFKLKLLLFLPLILGLASFKKVLGFLALVVPGLIGFFKLCKPDLHQNYGSYGHSNFYHQPPQHSHSGLSTYYGSPYSRDTEAQPASSYGNVAFRDESSGQQLAYRGYQQT